MAIKNSRIIVGSLVYNEEHKFLQRYLSNIQKYADEIVLIDDGSTDNSLNICKNYTNHVFTSNRLFIENELQIRYALWSKCIKLCNEGDFILIQDCDEILHEDSIEHLKEEIDRANYLECDSIAWRLYDMWSETHYRSDNYWTAHLRWWVHAVRYSNRIKYIWYNSKLHCGRIPMNSYYHALPTNMQILHMGYSTKELREKKYDFYMNVDKENNGNLNQYKSILDLYPNLIEFESNYVLTKRRESG